MRKYRALYLSEVIVVAIIMFSLADKAESERSAEIAHDIASIVLSWSCAITAIGFARQYMNKTSKMRKLANEAIYPFYLLHQPVIVVTGYFTVHLEVPVLLKVIIVLTVSFSLTVIIYWFLIRPYNLTRVIFGMKKMERKRQESGSGLLLQPIEAKIKRSLPGKDSKSI
jgi:glucan biosynthesis protein C